MRLAVGLLTTIAVLFVSACDTPPPETPLKGAGRPAAIKKRGKLVIATRNAPTVWYIDRNGDPAGPEHDLAKAFAASLGVKADFRRFDSVAGMLDAVRAGRVDLAAGGLTLTSDREAQADFGPAYESVTQMLESLRKQHPGLHWNVVNDLGTEQLLRKVWKGEIDCTIADSNIARVNRRYYPDLLVMFNLTQPQKLAWPMPRGSDKLAAVVKHWLDDYRRTGKLHRVMERYYGFIVKFNYVDKAKLRERLDGRYNRYAEIFAQAAENTPFSPALLAAQAYQESRWNPNAVSPTGVRGIMMLTRSTARAMGVKNRLDPRHSIRGGARYLARMEDRLDDAIPLPDRNYFALAAYNVGFAHLRDAMHLTGERGKTRAAGKMYATSCRYWPKSGTTSI
jgi:membrane-bound lytic murein transglycosylase F